MLEDPDLEILTASIDNQTTGRWVVTTESGARYLLNLNRRWVSREPEPSSTRMRRDNSAVGLVELVRCKVGDQMRLIVNIRQDGIFTIRYTTPVINIKQLR